MEKYYLGLIKLGQLKRIQRVLFAHYETNQSVLKQINEDELAYILKGKGSYLPVWLENKMPISRHKKNTFKNYILQRNFREVELKRAVAEINKIQSLSKPR